MGRGWVEGWCGVGVRGAGGVGGGGERWARGVGGSQPVVWEDLAHPPTFLQPVPRPFERSQQGRKVGEKVQVVVGMKAVAHGV